ncbi:DNA starvation/stationary phase protection protein [Cohnella sp. CIP 111063]|uniref:Dps family protein n=1 Tax=unclassified Cohnella TaxID=2636738 RepID=UPI000B8BF6A2|nr:MULTISPECIES: Dps family protein [unclassified Cohnella]OXS57657.1 DNA starvation/stationary phase protection protein [Cohnella sp. CIP 111063]PRX71043.1 starvation-inducible DNA-binding protein [Cohnella sp. SGD-V74]
MSTNTNTTTVGAVLNQQIANWTVLHMKLHNYHWYVKGPQFFTLHAKFEELYTEAAANVDVLAERLLATGGNPVATLADSLRLSSVREASGDETAERMATNVAEDFAQLAGELRQGIKIAESCDDQDTADLLLGMKTNLEKHAWMLNAFAGR